MRLTMQKVMNKSSNATQVKRASIPAQISKKTGIASGIARNLTEISNDEIIKSLDREQFYDVETSAGLAAKAVQNNPEDPIEATSAQVDDQPESTAFW